MSQARREGPLQDLTIIDCTMAYAGPFGTTLLADLGANVIKIEPPNGDTFRIVGPFPNDHGRINSTKGVDYGAAFASVNRNKRSVALDLKKDADREILFQLCEQADAVVENMRAGVMDKLGVGYDELLKRNPQIVYGAVRGYGDPRTGESPYAQWPCLDPVGQSVGGLVEATGDLYGLALADIYPGTLMALGLLAAVLRARSTGKGEFFDVAMYDGVQALLKTSVAQYGITGKDRKASTRSLVPFGLFPASDGQIALAAPVESHWALLCQAMEREDLIADERTRSNLRRAKNADFTEAQVSAWTSNNTREQIMSLLGGKVPCGPANTMADVFADAHMVARDMLQPVDYPGDNPPGVLSGNPIKFLNTTTGLYQAPPKHGEHTSEVLKEFGIEV